MTTKTYVDFTTPVVDADWLNDVDRLLYDILGNPADDAAVLTGLGITATAAELNALDGITATVTELNYVDGVTSAIQTQLNAKAALAGNAAQAFAASTFTGDLTGNVTGNASTATTATIANALTGEHTSGTIASSVTATTQAITDSSTKVATTAFVKALFSPITNSLSGDVTLTTQSVEYTGPTIAQGTVGTWFVSGTVCFYTGAGGDNFEVKLWDGTTVIASARVSSGTSMLYPSCALSGYIASPAGDLRITAKNTSRAGTLMTFNSSGYSKDSTITAIRIS